jgi:hypothetical protein
MQEQALKTVDRSLKNVAGWRSPVSRQAHNLKVGSSNLSPAPKTTGETHEMQGD